MEEMVCSVVDDLRRGLRPADDIVLMGVEV